MLQLERNFLRHAIEWKLGCYRPYHPLCAYVYFTFRCNLACVYCNDGSGKKYGECDNSDELDTDGWRRVLDILRRETDVLIITGGEPTCRSDLAELLQHCRRLGFSKVCLLTNGLTLDRHPEVLEYADILMISLDTLDEAKADAMMGAPSGTLRRILDNVELAAAARRTQRFKLYFNICITPANVSDVHDVLDFALERSIGFTPLPEIVAHYPRAGLKDNPDYEGLIDRILALKRAGADVLGTSAYLTGIRGFDAFHCLPTLLARVWPNGDLCYPCQKLHTVGGNLLELGSLERAVDEGIRRHGPLPTCDNRCHVGCYMDFSMAIQHPGMLVREGWYTVKRRFFHPREHINQCRRPSVPAAATGKVR